MGEQVGHHHQDKTAEVEEQERGPAPKSLAERRKRQEANAAPQGCQEHAQHLRSFLLAENLLAIDEQEWPGKVARKIGPRCTREHGQRLRLLALGPRLPQQILTAKMRSPEGRQTDDSQGGADERVPAQLCCTKEICE